MIIIGSSSKQGSNSDSRLWLLLCFRLKIQIMLDIVKEAKERTARCRKQGADSTSRV